MTAGTGFLDGPSPDTISKRALAPSGKTFFDTYVNVDAYMSRSLAERLDAVE